MMVMESSQLRSSMVPRLLWPNHLVRPATAYAARLGSHERNLRVSEKERLASMMTPMLNCDCSSVIDLW